MNNFSSSTTMSRFKLIGLGIGYLISLLICYNLIFIPVYLYPLKNLYFLSVWHLIFGIFLSIIPLFWLPIKINIPSDVAAWFIYISVIAPCGIAPFLLLQSDTNELLILPLTMTSAFLLFDFIRRQPTWRIKVPVIRDSSALFFSVLPILLFAASIYSFSLSHFTFQISLDDVYDRRIVARDIVGTKTSTAYISSLLNSTFIPLAVILGWKKRSILFLSLAGFGVLSTFSLSGSKSIVVIPLIIMFVLHITTKHAEKAGLWIFISIIILVLLAISEYFGLGTTNISTYFVRRQLFGPAQMTSYYWDFFSQNKLVFMSDSIINSLLHIEPRYSLPTTRLIGKVYFGSEALNANVNIFGAGFAHFGYIGIFAVSILAALILRITDSISKHIDFASSCALVGNIGVIWTNGALHTSMFSNGVFFLLLALFIFPRNLDSYTSSDKFATNKTHKYS